MLRIVKLDRYDMINNPGEDNAAFTIWFGGCSRGCKNCHNPELQPSDKGEQYDVKTILFVVCNECEKQDIDTVILLGGEPLEQNFESLTVLTNKLHQYGYKIWLYTGYEFEDVPETLKSDLYTIKCGSYVDELKCDGFPSSTNQRVFRKINNKWEQIHIGGDI